MNTSTGPIATHQTALSTSRMASRQERGVLAVLRALIPRRPLTPRETLALAELQANKLLELAGRPQAPIPNELITELPRIVVRHDPDLPVSGSAHWAAGRWQLTINASEPWTRQRFSLAHELKHVIDHRYVEMLYENGKQAEMAADYFAACLLMPKREVMRAWCQGTQKLAAIAEQFAVSPAAMARRLEYLGLRTPARRAPSPSPSPARRGHYTRPSSFAIGATA